MSADSNTFAMTEWPSAAAVSSRHFHQNYTTCLTYPPDQQGIFGSCVFQYIRVWKQAKQLLVLLGTILIDLTLSFN